MANVNVDISGDAARLIREQAKITRQQAQILRGYQKLGGGAQQAGRHASRAARRVSDDSARVGSAIKSQIAGLVGMLGISSGLAGAVNLVKTGFENWRDILGGITTEMKKAGDEIIAFAALQAGGTKAERVTAASQLAQRYGITERGAAFDTVQAMQSILGDFPKGMQAAETIFRAKQVGIPIELGKELEVLGISAGLKPGEALRKAYVAGELSGRTPAAMAGSAQAMGFFTDKDFMFALGARLAGEVPERNIPTYMKRLGMGLMPTSGLKEWYQARGLGAGATQQQRFAGIADALAGMTEEQQHVFLQEAGLAEVRERQATVAVSQDLPRILADMQEIQRQAVPGLLAEKRAQVEAELPWMATLREMDMIRARYADEKAFGARGGMASEWDKERAVRGLALKELGKELAFGYPTITETDEGLPDAGPGAEFKVRLQELLKPIFWGRRAAAGGRRMGLLSLIEGIGRGVKAEAEFFREIEARKADTGGWHEAHRPRPREPEIVSGTENVTMIPRRPKSGVSGVVSVPTLDDMIHAVSRAADTQRDAANRQAAAADRQGQTAERLGQAAEMHEEAIRDLRRVTDRMGGGGGRRLGSPTEDR